MKKQGFTELAVLADLGAWPWAGYSTSDALLTNRRDKLKRWTRAMVKSLQLMQTRPEETYKIAQAEFKHPRDITEGAANICIKAIDPRNPGGASDESLRNNIDLTITQPLKLTAQPPIAKLVDFSLLLRSSTRIGVSGNNEAGMQLALTFVLTFVLLAPQSALWAQSSEAKLAALEKLPPAERQQRLLEARKKRR